MISNMSICRNEFQKGVFIFDKFKQIQCNFLHIFFSDIFSFNSHMSDLHVLHLCEWRTTYKLLITNKTVSLMSI